MRNIASILIVGLFFLSIAYGQENQFPPNSEILKTAFLIDAEEKAVATKPQNIDQDFSVSLWFKSSDLLSGYVTIIDIAGIYWIRTTTGREIQFAQPNILQVDSKGAALSQNTWYHLTVSVDFPFANIFLNGEQINSFQLEGKAIYKNQNIILGRNDWREYFNGKIAGFEFHEKSLNQEDVSDLYNNSKSTYPLNHKILAFLPLENKNISGKLSENPEFSNISFTEDEIRGKVAKFDSLSYIDLGKIKFDNTITVAAWVKPNKKGRLALVSSGHTFAFRIANPKTLLFTIPQIKDYFANSNEILLNQWHHVAMTYHEDKLVCFYINGKKIKETPLTEHQNASKKIRIGNNIWNDHYLGYMDDVIIWNRILSQKEIKSIYKLNSFDLNEIMPKPLQKSNQVYLYISLIITSALALFIIFYKAPTKQEPSNKKEEKSPFKQKVESIVLENISNSSFNVQEFSKVMGMSRTSLYKTMKAEYKNSPKEFIRETRLDNAAELIKNSSKSISEIIFSTGFESRAYFNKCFKDRFNCTPTEFRKLRT